MTERPFEGVVVLGFPRSGTTMLRRLLGTHPQLCCPPETHVWRACAAFLHEDDTPLGHSVDVATSLRYVGIDPEHVAERVRQLGFGLLRDVSAQYGKPIWVEKSALDIFHADAIDRLLGDRCRYLWIVRHPGDVVSSVKEYVAKVEIYYPEFHDYIRRYPAPLEAFAHAWADTQERMIAFAEKHRDTCLKLRYEDLVAAPNHQLDRILSFLDLEGDAGALLRGLGESPGVVGYGDWKTYERTTVGEESVGRFRSLPPRLLARIGAIVNPIAGQIGYEPIVVPEQALRPDPVRELKLSQALTYRSAHRAQGAKRDGSA